MNNNNRVNEEKKSDGVVVEVYEWLEAISFALAIVVLIFTFVFRIVSIKGPSMQPTLHEGDRVILNNLFYKPQNGDVIVIVQPNSKNEPLIKRVIAVEGQTIDIVAETNTVTVDGVVQEENYTLENFLNFAGDSYEYPVTVPEGKVFVMGDNRNDSFDSRYSGLGMVDEKYIMGKAIFRLYPFESVGGIK